MAARNLPSPKRTVVQHSGFGYNGDPIFSQGLETRQITTVAEARKVEKAGGILFDSYEEAERFADKAMYPADNRGMVPTARGTFSAVEIDGLALYIPVREVVG